MKKHFLLFSFLFVVKILSAQTFVSYINPIDKRFIDSTFIDETGRKVIKVVVPGSPPPKFGYNKVAANISSNAVMLDSVPAFSWSFGCTATSAAMIAGYFDRHGYVNIYSGPTNNGLCPISNSAWGSIILNGEQRDICPLSATMKNVDGRAIRGHVDDYWIQYGSSANDPYITNGWTQHNYQDCTGDFMRTNQSAYGNSDGATTYYFYSNGTPYQGTENADGPYGFQKFLESRGYKVNKRFTQTIKGYDGNSTGFTLNDYKNEIDAGRPVMIHVVGHTMVGCGYDLLTQTIYIHNTWDYNVHSMIWGGEYEGMQMISASVFGLDPVSNCVVPTALKATNITNTSADLSWLESGASTAWELVYYPVNNIGQTVTKTVVDTSKLSVSGLASETKYSWKVRSKCGDRFSDWSVSSEFTTYRSNDLYLVSKLPVGADNVPDNGIYLSFNKTVKPGTGKIKIYNSSDVLFKEVLASNCIYSGLNVFIPCLLEPNTSYYILVDSNAFSDEVGNLFPGILSKSGWTFQTTGSDVYCQITDPSGKYFSNASIYYSISSGANINPIYTNEYGIAKISNPAFPGSLTLIGKFNGTNYLVLKKGISGPKSVFVELSKEDLVDLTLLAKNDQGIALPNSSVYIKPSGINEVFSFGQTLNDGQMICKVSRMLYDQIQVVNFSSQYLLKKNSINCSGSASSYAVDFDASKIPVCKIKPEFTGTFSRKDMLVSINFWGFIFNSDNPLITISTGEPIFYEAWLYKNSNKEELDFYGVNSPVNPSPNETVSIKFDDKVNLELSPDKTTYKPGDIIKLNNKIIDSFNNKALYSWLGSATDNFESVVKLVNPLSTSSFKPYKNELDSTQVNASVYPRITVSDPSGNIIVNIAGQSSWANYEFTLPSQSQEGDYNIEYSFNFGQWANQLLVKKTFKVGLEVPVITSFYPENHSVNVEPDCIPSLTFNTTVEAGTGTVTVYKSDGSVYSRIPASSCIYENNVVRLPRLLDVNSTFYILTDDNAFRNSKGKVAGIKQTTVWGFQTSGSGVYGQVFDVSGNLVSGAAVTYSFTKDKSGYGFYSSTNRYGIFRISSPTVFDISTIGELWISASSVGYIVGKVNVSGVSSTIFKLNEEPTVTLTIQSQGRDNLANAGASVYVCPNNLDNFNGGNLDQNGNLLLHITPVNISFVSVLNWNKRLVLSTTGIDCSTGLNSYTHKLNATELGLSEIRPKILFTRQDDYTTYYGHHIAPNLKGEESVWLSSNYPSWFRGAWYIKNEAATNLRWEYGLSPETNDVTLAKGKVIDISWGDPVKISAKPDKSNYLPGGQVTLSNKVSDQFGNNIRSCNTYLRNNSSATLGNYLTRQNVEGDSVRRIVSFAESNNEPITAQSGETIYPVIKVTSPDGSILVNYSGWNSWYSYRFNLPTNAAEGKYYIDYSFNSGPLAGLLAVRDSFVVKSQRHFVPVWTGKGVDHMNINVYSARLDGQDLEVGDEIGIFDGTKCVGVGQVQQSISQTHVLDIIASRDEGTGNGYISGNAIIYRFYDKSKTQEVLNITASYSSADVNWITDGRYAVDGTSFVSLNGATTATQTISFSAGWNIVSANVKPSNTDMKALFQSLIDAGKLKKVMDESGKTLENFGMFGGWKNNIGNWQPTEGYKVNVTAATKLVLEGTPFMLPYDIPLTTGWNIVSYPAVSSQDVKAAFQSLIDSGKLKKVMDESGKTLENFGMFGGWKNNIGSLAAGKGYKVNVTGSCTLTITEGGTKGATIVPEVLASTHFAPVYSGNGIDHMNIHLVNLQASGIKVGDEIGIYDGSLCVGSATIGAEQLMDGSISIPASSNDGLDQTMNGFTCGNPVNLQLFRAGQTYQLNIEKFSGINSFDKNQSLFAQVNIDELDGSRNSNNSDQFKCFPNPFDQEINIEVQYAKPTEILIEIYNITGQRIKTLFKGTNNGNLLVKWNGTSESGQKVAPGVYLCKVNGQSKQLVFK